MIKNPTLRAEMGQVARERARQEFCASKIVLKYEDLYHQTIRQASSR